MSKKDKIHSQLSARAASAASLRRRGKSYTFTVLALLIFAACGQPEELKFPAALNNQKTAGHITVAGTGISLILPEFLSYASPYDMTYFGSVGRDTCMMLFREDHIKNYYDFLPTFRTANEQAYQSVEEETHLTVNGFPAVVLFIHQDSEHDGYHLLFGDSTFAAYIMTVHPNHAHKLKEKIFKSLATVSYSADAGRAEQAIQQLKQFYTAYILCCDSPDGNEEIQTSIRNKYLTKSLLHKLENSDLDYDPLIQAQDCDRSWIETIEIKPDTERQNVYTVSYTSTFDNEKTIKLLLANDNGNYLIDDILSDVNICEDMGNGRQSHLPS
jgi:hypothetical protein